MLYTDFINSAKSDQVSKETLRQTSANFHHEQQRANSELIKLEPPVQLTNKRRDHFGKRQQISTTNGNAQIQG